MIVLILIQITKGMLWQLKISWMVPVCRFRVVLRKKVLAKLYPSFHSGDENMPFCVMNRSLLSSSAFARPYTRRSP